MTPLGQHYVRQAGGGGRGDSGIGPVYSAPPFIQRGHGIGSFLRGLWRTVRPVLWSNAKSLGREALRTGGNIMSDIADNPAQTGVRDILSNHVSESALNIVKTYAAVVAVYVREREHLSANRVSKRPRELESRNENHLLKARPLPRL